MTSSDLTWQREIKKGKKIVYCDVYCVFRVNSFKKSYLFLVDVIGMYGWLDIM